GGRGVRTSECKGKRWVCRVGGAGGRGPPRRLRGGAGGAHHALGDAGRLGRIARCRPAASADTSNEVDQKLRRHSREVLMSFRSACTAMAGAILITFAPAALAQDWPNRSIVAACTTRARH